MWIVDFSPGPFLALHPKQVAKRFARDWQSKYGHPVVLLETFVERERFRGTVYRAANWQSLGVTAGRSRQDRHTCIQVAVKDI